MPEHRKRILVPVDGSEPSMRAVDLAAEIASATDAEIDLVSVVDLHQVDVYDGFYLTKEQLSALKARAQEHILDDARARVPEV